MRWEVTLYVKPEPKQSTDFARGGAHTDPLKRNYQSKLAVLAQRRAPERLLSGPLVLNVVFVFPFRKSDLKLPSDVMWLPHDIRPDSDNLAKPVRDALVGVVYKDDAVVWTGNVSKIRYRTSEGAIWLEVIEEAELGLPEIFLQKFS